MWPSIRWRCLLIISSDRIIPIAPVLFLTGSRIDVNLKSAPNDAPMETFADENGGSNLVQAFTQSRIDLLKGLTLNTGIHMQWLTLNNSFTVEPRIGLRWKVSEKQTVSAAYGLHSRMEPIGFYLARQTNASGSLYAK